MNIDDLVKRKSETINFLKRLCLMPTKIEIVIIFILYLILLTGIVCGMNYYIKRKVLKESLCASVS